MYAGGGKIRCTHTPYGLKEMQEIADVRERWI